MLMLDRALTDRSQVARAVNPPTASLDAGQRRRLRELLGQPPLQLPQLPFDTQVRRWMPLGVPLLAVLLATSILLIWATVL